MELTVAGIKTAVSQQVLQQAYDGTFLATPINFNSPVTDKVPSQTQATQMPCMIAKHLQICLQLALSSAGGKAASPLLQPADHAAAA